MENVEQKVESVVLNEEEEIKKANEMEMVAQQTGNTFVESFDKPSTSDTRKKIRTTITDPKILFNLDSHVDCKINDMEGKEIELVDVIVKEFEKDIPERINEYTGEIETVERSIVTILVDKTGTSYVTASKMFALRISQLVQMYGVDGIHKGVKIRIIKCKHKNTENKKLDFEIV